MNAFKKSLVALFAFCAVAMAPKVSHADFHLLTVEKASQFHLINSAMADDVVPSPSPSAAPAAQSVGDKIGSVGDVLGSIADHVPTGGMPITILVMVVGFIYDFVRRKWPTANPASLWKDVKSVIAGLKKLALGFVKLLEAADSFGDQVLGQNVKPPQA